MSTVTLSSFLRNTKYIIKVERMACNRNMLCLTLVDAYSHRHIIIYDVVIKYESDVRDSFLDTLNAFTVIFGNMTGYRFKVTQDCVEYVLLSNINDKNRNYAKDWYCPSCNCNVQNNHVTFAETHDIRYGGCGKFVEPKQS